MGTDLLERVHQASISKEFHQNRTQRRRYGFSITWVILEDANSSNPHIFLLHIWYRKQSLYLQAGRRAEGKKIWYRIGCRIKRCRLQFLCTVLDLHGHLPPFAICPFSWPFPFCFIFSVFVFTLKSVSNLSTVLSIGLSGWKKNGHFLSSGSVKREEKILFSCLHPDQRCHLKSTCSFSIEEKIRY